MHLDCYLGGGDWYLLYLRLSWIFKTIFHVVNYKYIVFICKTLGFEGYNN